MATPQTEPRPERRWCRLARLVTLIVDLVPTEHQDTAEGHCEDMIDVFTADIRDTFNEGVRAGRDAQQTADAAQLAAAEAQIAALRLEIAAHTAMEAALTTEPPTVTH